MCEPFKASYWQKYGWFRALKPEPQPEPQPDPPEPTGATVEVVGKSVNVRNKDSKNGRILFTAHKGDIFPFVAVAPSGWYEIETKRGTGYITNKGRYTKLNNE